MKSATTEAGLRAEEERRVEKAWRAPSRKREEGRRVGSSRSWFLATAKRQSVVCRVVKLRVSCGSRKAAKNLRLLISIPPLLPLVIFSRTFRNRSEIKRCLLTLFENHGALYSTLYRFILYYIKNLSNVTILLLSVSV